jgi:hypothetical protein
MQILEVGKPYVEGKRHWPQAVEYTYSAQHHLLRIFYRTPHPKEVKAVDSGEARFAFGVYGAAIFLHFRFGEGIPWHNAPYSIHLVNDEDRILPDWPIPQGEHALLSTLLVDAETGILKAIRVCTFSPEFTLKLHQAILNQYAMPFPPDYDKQVIRAYQQYPTPELMAERLSVAWCRGGD